MKLIKILLVLTLITAPCYAGDGSAEDNTWKVGQGFVCGMACRGFGLNPIEAVGVTVGLSCLKELGDQQEYGFNWNDVWLRSMGAVLRYSIEW